MLSFIRRMGLVMTVVVALVAAANTWATPAALHSAVETVKQDVTSLELKP